MMWREFVRHKRLIQFIEYMIGGGVYFWSGLAVFAMLYSGLEIDWLLAKMAADVVGFSLSYFVQRYWVFNDPRLKRKNTQTGLRYFLISAVTLAVDYGIVSKQSHPAFEVIVSDAQSKDHTADVIKQYQSKLNLIFVQSPPKGPSNGRNLGAERAKGEWLLFLDADDDTDDSDFISTLVATAMKQGWGSASARINPATGNLKERIGMGLNYRYIKLLAKTKHPVAPGWCILTKKAIFDKLGGFNEKIHFGEDYDYVSRAGKDGFGFVEDTYYYVDFRRAREEGWRLTTKAILNEVYRHTHGYNLENNPFKYEFGKHKARK